MFRILSGFVKQANFLSAILDHIFDTISAVKESCYPDSFGAGEK